MKGKLIVIAGIDGSGKTVQTDLLAKRLEAEGYNWEQIDFPQYGKTFFADLIVRYLRGEFNCKIMETVSENSANPQSQLAVGSWQLAKNSWQLAVGNEQTATSIQHSQPKIQNPKSINPYFTSLLYAGDRWECRARIIEWLQKGKIIIANRYTCCNKAYQGAKIDNIEEKKRFFDWVDTLEYQVYKIPAPDVIIFLKSDVEIAIDLIRKRTPREYHYPQEDGLVSNSPLRDKAHRDIHEEDMDYLRLAQKTYIELASNEKGWEIIECVRGGRLLDKAQVAEEVWNAVKKTVPISD